MFLLSIDDADDADDDNDVNCIILCRCCVAFGNGKR